MDEETDWDDPPPFAKFGIVLAGAIPFKFNSNVNDVYRGEVFCSDGSTVLAFIKDLDRREFASELFAAAIGLELGLPIPIPIIAKASPEVMRASKLSIRDSPDFLVFASSAASAPPILQVLRDAGMTGNDLGAAGREVLARLAGWSGLGLLYGFDAWMANIDRHRGNLLFGGQSDVWLIDHGNCFSGSAWDAAKLDPAGAYRNRLQEWLTPSLVGSRRSELAAVARDVGRDVSKSTIERLGQDNGAMAMLQDDFDAILQFLIARASHVPRLATAALGMLL